MVYDAIAILFRGHKLIDPEEPFEGFSTEWHGLDRRTEGRLGRLQPPSNVRC